MKTLRWFILLWPGIISAQWSFDFEENFLNEWGQTPESRWEISPDFPLSGEYSLHHAFDNTGSGEDYVFVNLDYPQLDSTLTFSFLLRHAYNPSSGNNWQLCLLSQLPDQITNSFVLGVNYKGSDDLVKLWQVTDGDAVLIVQTEIDYEEDIGRDKHALYVISRTASGLWSVKIDVQGDGNTFSKLWEGMEQKRCEGKYLTIRYCYSSAQDRKLWIDDILADGVFYKDTVLPLLEHVEITGLSSLQLHFSENIFTDVETSFQWNDLAPDSVTIHGKMLQLFFPSKFLNREEQKLYISGVFDQDANRMNDTLACFTQNLIAFGEVQINEIMFDPEPVVYLPPCEYIELLNRCNFDIDLSSWLLTVNSKEYMFDTCEILSNDFLVLTSVNQECSFEEKTLLLFTSSSALTNAGAEVKLFDQYGRLIHLATYKEMSFYDPLKDEGGWSLESTNPGLSCGGDKNWCASEDVLGGSPGRENSILVYGSDVTAPEITYIGIADTNSIFIHFSEPVFVREEENQSVYAEKLGEGTPVYHTSPLVSEVVEFSFSEIFKNQTIYSINISEIADCEDNIVLVSTVEFSLPVSPEPNSIVLNEVMYDPFIGREEYLELYNASENYLDLKDLKYSVSANNSTSESLYWMSKCSHVFSPGKHVVFTKNVAALRDNWGLPFWLDAVELSDWKSLPNAEGYISLLNRSDILLDKFAYSDSMHHELLIDPSGVALERISPYPGSLTWTSASAAENYGTPGTINSQWRDEEHIEAEVIVRPQVFSPDMDGYNDVTEIILSALPAGSFVSIHISDMHGVEVLRLIENGICGSEDRYFWDGHDMNHNLVLPGLYVVHIRISGKGREKIHRLSCALSYR